MQYILDYLAAGGDGGIDNCANEGWRVAEEFKWGKRL